MLAMGFTKIRMWYQAMNFNFANADEYCSCYCETVTARNLLSKVSEEKREAFIVDLKNEFEKRMGPKVLDPNSFEVMVIIAEKP